MSEIIPPGYGRLVGRVISAVTVEEGPVPLAGARVTFRPSVPRVTRDGDPTPLVVGSPVECSLDAEGFLLGPDGGRGVLLVATDADTRPAGWHWVVRVQAPSVTSYQWTVLVPEGVTTDMIAATSDPAASGLPLLEWRGILSDVWGAHSDVVSAVQAVDQDRQWAMAARAGAEQAAGRAETAADAADVHADSADESQLQAMDAKRDAEQAAGSALAARGDAELFAGHAEASAEAAAGSALVAEVARDSAASSATNAATAATNATVAKTGAETAAATATLQASSAVSSATAAAASATNAATSASAAASSATEAQAAAEALKDTGWRNIAELISPSYTVGPNQSVQIRRTGDFVTVRCRVTCGPTPSVIFIPTLPTGFRAATPYTALGVVLVGEVIRAVGSLSSSVRLDFSSSLPAGAVFGMEVTYRTNQSFPTTLPGTPA